MFQSRFWKRDMGFWVQKKRRSSSSLALFFVFLLTTIFLGKSVGVASALEYPNGKQPSKSRLWRIQKELAKINKPAVLSINSPDGDIIDCVSKWNWNDQPLLKNHTLLVAPSKILPSGKKREDVEFSERVPVQVWHLNGTRCPKDTVPVRRTTVKDLLMAKSHRHRHRHHPRHFIIKEPTPGPERRQYAIARADAVKVFGAGATMGIWNPMIGDPEEFSLAQIWVFHQQPDAPDELTTIEFGWHVFPSLFGGDRHTKLFVYWTRDNYRSTGCYNLECPGFVPTGDFVVPGLNLSPYSIVNGVQYEATFNIYQEASTGRWWLTYGVGEVTYEVGYFPADVLPALRNGATGADWGGEVLDKGRRGAHTITQMGSGRYSSAGLDSAAYFAKIYVVGEDGGTPAPQILGAGSTNANCYTISTPAWNDSVPHLGFHFFYGGPGGGNPECGHS